MQEEWAQGITSLQSLWLGEFPKSPLLDEVHHLPAALLQTVSDEPAVAPPGQTLGAEDGASAPGRQSLQEFHSPEVVRGLGISLIASFPIPAQLFAQIKIAETSLPQGLGQGLFLEMGKFADRKAAHVHGHLDGGSAQEPHKFPEGSGAGSQGVDDFLRSH